MKNIFYLTLFFPLFINSQIVNIPDESFKMALVQYYNPPIDTNNDGEIQVSEAEAFTGVIDLYDPNWDVFWDFYDVTGIEYFTNMTGLDISGNYQLTTLNLSNSNELIELYFDNCSIENLILPTNKENLKILSCSSNNISNIELSEMINLEYLNLNYNNGIVEVSLSNLLLLEELHIAANDIINLDLSTNTELTFLSCGGNLISNLDLNNNIKLRNLSCSVNEFETLDLSNNINLIRVSSSHNSQLLTIDIRNGNNEEIMQFTSFNNPNLNCIFVDDVEFSEINWFAVDDNSTFVETEQECDAILAISEQQISNKIIIIPNPIKSNFTIQSENDIDNAKVKIFNVLGKKVHEFNYFTFNNIDISNLEKGMYFITIQKNNQLILSSKILKI